MNGINEQHIHNPKRKFLEENFRNFMMMMMMMIQSGSRPNPWKIFTVCYVGFSAIRQQISKYEFRSREPFFHLIPIPIHITLKKWPLQLLQPHKTKYIHVQCITTPNILDNVIEPLDTYPRHNQAQHSWMDVDFLLKPIISTLPCASQPQRLAVKW